MRVIFSMLAFALTFNAYAQTASESSTKLPPGWWQIPKTETRLKIGGYVKFDLIHDFKPIGSPDFFDVSKIPTDGSKGESTHLNAKESRVFLDFRKPSKVGEMRAYVEGDFYGASGAFRLRHAFVEIGGKWLAGQWWSNFMDESVIPGTLDFELPAAYVFMRHPMLRYKHSFSPDSYLGIALEEPSANGQAPAEQGKFESPLPDLTARYRVTKKWGHVQLSAFAGKLQYRFDTGSTESVSIFGVNLSGQLNLFAKDKLIYQLVYGPGVGRFRGGLSASLDGNGNLEALTDTGVTIGYQHQWAPAFTSFIVLNHGVNDNTAGQPPSSLNKTNYVAANLIWHFVENAYAGVEYLYGTREDKGEADGSASRLQMSVKYVFN